MRRCISALGLLDPADVLPGIERLARDLAAGAWHARHGHLLDEDSYDGGMRLIVRDPR